MQSYVNVLNSTDLHIKNDKFMLCVFITIKKKKSYLWSQGKSCRGNSDTTFELCKYII